MREIKFRAWDRPDKVMYHRIEKGLIFDDSSQYTFADYLNNKGYHKWEFMQYTGLKDKNSKEIYEGDIIQMTIDTKKGAIINTVVEFRQGMFVYNPLKSKTVKNPKEWDQSHDFSKSLWWCGGPYPLCSGFYGYGNPDNTEIIGNIYENPELIEEQK